MNEPGKRIKELRKKSGLTQQELADLIGISRVAVSKWESQGDLYSHPKGEYLAKLCKILQTSPDYIYYGILPGEDDSSYAAEPVANYGSNVEPAQIRKSLQVPIVSWVQAGETHVAFVEDDLDEIEKFTTYVSCSKGSYALRVNGDSMTSLSGPYSFPPGSIIVIDPEQKGDTTDGIFVVAKENGNDAVTFKQLKYDGGKPYLNPLNPNYQKYFGEFRILGKVVDFRPVALP